ncbi:MAG: hypothetical protein QNL12_14090 [Acidimicrobiia bacterium]|nr:hypothetical protein [Acidimicrobiia bacterium]MDX2468445.1 hypothetical protein [Acidimicrobiia bacterium]
MWSHKDKLVPIAEFADRAIAEDAWAVLEEAEIPANVLTEPGAFGTPVLHRIEVERANVPTAQALIAHLVKKKNGPT